VARRAEVSIKTVSRVVNLEGGVSPDLVARVEAAVEALGYRRDERARQLRLANGRSRIIGLIQVDAANASASAIYRGLEDVATDHGYHVIAGSSDGDPAQQDILLRALVAQRVDGLVVVPAGDRFDELAGEIRRGTPVVLLDLEPPPGAVGDLVDADHRGGARRLTRHLIAHGHVRIAYVGDDPLTSAARARHLGFTDAIREAELTSDPDWVSQIARAPRDSERIVTAMFGEHPSTSSPTALVTARDFVTVGAVRALHAMGLQHRVALAAFDDLELADVVEPGITVMSRRPRELGRRAGELIFRRIEGDRSPLVVEVAEDQLISRGSGELRPT
jgi:LacI family transcriptional regulator